MSIPQRTQFSLIGTSISLDERMHAVRGDLADIALAGQLFVPHYAQPMTMMCIAVRTPVRESSKPDAKMTSELLAGEEFMVVEMSGNWAWGYCRHDHYVGYVSLAALGPVQEGVSSVVTVREASVFNAPGDNAVADILPMGCKVIGTPSGDYLETDRGFVALQAVDGSFTDPVAVAEALVDTPYLWGGRSSAGIDCSGLVQLGFALAHDVAAPRDSDQQEHQLGDRLDDDAPLQRNDVIFFPGHVGMMASATDLIHATIFHGKVVREPLADVIARVQEKHGVDITARRRVF